MPGDGTKTATTTHKAPIWLRYRRRLIRKKLLWRAFRSRRELTLAKDRRDKIEPNTILAFTTLRNEVIRIPFFLNHYRSLGVGHFFMIDNGSTDESAELLRRQPDVTLYQTQAGYRASRFGVDWTNWLLRRFGSGHWCVIADVDEALIYPDWDRRDLKVLTSWLDRHNHAMMGAIMLDMYPQGPPDQQIYRPGQDPFSILDWFDAHGYWVQRQPKLDNLWLQGGVRARCFFENTPEKAPTLNKIPLINWKPQYALVNSTHSGLPTHLNHVWKTGVSGALLHSKFLPGTATRAIEEKARDEHFKFGEKYADYYDQLAANPDMWHPDSTQYQGWRQLLALGLISQEDWL